MNGSGDGGEGREREREREREEEEEEEEEREVEMATVSTWCSIGSLSHPITMERTSQTNPSGSQTLYQRRSRSIKDTHRETRRHGGTETQSKMKAPTNSAKLTRANVAVESITGTSFSRSARQYPKGRRALN